MAIVARWPLKHKAALLLESSLVTDLGCTVLSSSLERQVDPPLLMAKEHRGKDICKGKAKREEIFYRHKR